MGNITKEEFKEIVKKMREECATGKEVKIFLENKLTINKNKS